MENWKSAAECFGHVEVSDLANVRVKARIVQTTRNGKPVLQPRREQPIKQLVNARGYLIVQVSHNKKKIYAPVHRLVARAFVAGWKDGLQVNHKNGIKIDNRPENLEWVTSAENVKHEWAIGLCNLRGENSPLAKLTNAQALEIYNRATAGEKCRDLAVEFGVSFGLVGFIRTKRAWKCIHN